MRRTQLILIFISYFLVTVPIYGEPSVLYLFSRYMLDWDAGSFGVFSMFKTISLTTGIFISMGVLSYLMSTRDSVIGILGSLSHVASCIVFAFVGSSGMMYLAGSVDVLNRAMPVVARAMGSKIVGMEEQGTLQSLLAVSDSICPVISNVVYTGSYHMD
jgi:PCFT/HCP family folate transporter-like MFS transporter 1/3